MLAEACERLLAAGELEEAAAAEVTLGIIHWYRIERDRALPHFEHAASLVEGAGPSRAKAEALTELARFAMLGDDDAKALSLATEALVMAEDFGLDDVRTRLLNTLGVARVKLGDRQGLADLERSLELTPTGSPERLRAFINLASILGELGELPRSFALHAEGLREAEAVGAPGPARWLRGERIWDEYLSGRWEAAVGHIEDFLADPEGRERHYMDASASLVRALIRLARGDEAGALADSQNSFALSREAQDPQVLFPSLALHGHVLLATGRRADAVAVADELVGLVSSSMSTIASWWSTVLAIVLTKLGRADEFAPVLAEAAMSTRWLDAARAYAAGAFEEAADIYADIGSVPDEAFARLRAAEALIEAGRRAEGDTQLQRALAFYRSVDATAYIREAESLFAASA